jgi:ATP-binding cassette, subfamily B, bacterial PglK
MVMFASMMGRSLRLLGREGRWRWAAVVVLALAVAGFEAIGAVLVYALMGLVSGEAGALDVPVLGDLTARLPDVPHRTLQIGAAAVVAGFFLVRAVVVVGETYLQSRLVYNAGNRLATHLVRGYLAMPYVTHTQLNSSELVRNAFDSVQSFVRQVLKPGVQVVAETVLVVVLTAVLLVITPVATLIALAVLGPSVGVLLAVVQPRLKALGRASQESRRGTLLAMQQALGGLRDIRLLGREREFARAFSRERRVMARTAYLKHTLAELPRVLIETTFVLVIALVFLLAVLTTDGPEAVVSTLGVFAYAGLRLQPSLRKIVQGLNHIRFGSATVDDLLADRARVDAALARRKGLVTPEGPRPLTRAIELRNVSFSYAPDAPPALRDVDLTIRRGEFVGICGPTGGGKSTLVDLIAGLLEPTAGEVLVDGEPLGPHPTWWYAQLGMVSQGVFLIDDTLRANIAFGQAPAEVDEEVLRRAVTRAQLGPVVDALPDGLDTIVGERGVRLSGGQRQRVAVARALYREPSVIVFDEGTSALDAATEAALVAAVDELKVGRTLISVAHRISTVRAADRIIVVEQGRIVADGCYDELLDRSALFRGLAR